MKQVVAAALFSLAAFSAPDRSARAAEAKAPRPNIVFLLADDLGWADVGFHGGEIKTPELDRLAAAGARLEQFYVQPVCTPTRASLMTGRYPIRHGLQVGVVKPHAQYGLPLQERTLAQALKEAGYETAICGKWHLGHYQRAYLPTQRGFDHQYGHYNGAIDYFTHVRDGGFDWHRDDKVCRDEGYSTHLLAREAARLIEQQQVGKPLFLYVPFNAVHVPHQVPEEYTAPYTNLQGVRRTYAGMVAAMDEAVGQIVAAVEKRGMRKQTLFIFCSDNGGPMPGRVSSNGPLRAGKATVYEGGVRVPAFATWAERIKPGSVVQAPLHMVDWYPGLLKVAGASLKQKLPLDGRDPWPAILEGKPSPHEEILHNAEPSGGALRRGDWKLIIKAARARGEPRARGERPSAERVELYNVARDPYEKTDLAGQHPDKVKELRVRYDAYARDALPPKFAPPARDFKAPRVWGEPD